MLLWDRMKSASTARDLARKRQCAKDLALAASFVRSLETDDREVNVQLQQLAGDLEQIAGRLGSVTAKAAA